jgi:hypothetical protein
LDVAARGHSTIHSTGLGLDIVRRAAIAADGDLLVTTSSSGGLLAVVVVISGYNIMLRPYVGANDAGALAFLPRLLLGGILINTADPHRLPWWAVSAKNPHAANNCQDN